MSKAIPEIRYKGFNNEWTSNKLGDVIDISSASRVHKEEWKNEGVPFFRSSDVISKYMKKYNNPAFISDALYQELSKKSGKMKADDILVTGGGTIGVPYLIENENPLYFKDADLIWLKNSGVIDGRFLYNFYINPQTRRYISSITHIGTISHYTIVQGKNTPISLPVKSEQEKIGTLFKMLDETIALQQQLVEQQQHYKKAMLQKMFPQKGECVPKIRFKGFSGDWEENKLKELGSTYTGLSGKTKEDFGHGQAKYVTYMNVLSNPIASKSQFGSIEIDTKQNLIRKGDVFFTTSSETPEEVGMSSVWIYDLDNVYLNSFTFAYRPHVNFDYYFLAYLLRSSDVRNNIKFLAQGISRYNISKRGLMEISIPFPSLEEQEKIGYFFKQLDDTIALYQKKLTDYQQLKKALLQRMYV